MKILVVEYFLAGMAGPIEQLPATLVSEARAMLRTLLESLARDPSFRVRTIIHPGADLKLPWEIDVTWTMSHPLVEIKSQLCRTDCFWPIAPETDGHLNALARGGRQYGVPTLVPGDEILALSCDKWETYRYLRSHGIATPETALGGDSPPQPGPWVVKPRDGVGSQEVRLVKSQQDLSAKRSMIVQRHHQGQDVSQVLVGGPGEIWFLPPCCQILKGNGSFEYLGGETPLEDERAARAEKLSRMLTESIGRFSGWMGIDMVLGDDPDGREDRIIEINPRLTTSFVGLDHLALAPLGPAVVRHALGQKVAKPAFATKKIRFSTMGQFEEVGNGHGRN